ncbi:MAG: SDR family NAD(P)-dependent oxidoreductase [Pseudomonadota bacterium]
MAFQGQTVWITGASSGIGAALAKAFEAKGANLILSGRREDALKEVAAEAGAEHLILPFEATDYDALPAIVQKAEGWQGGVDVLINNAGISQRSLAIDTDFSVYEKIMDIDFFAPVRLTQLVLPGMVERGSGHLAVVSSVAGRVGAPLRTAYCAAKHACCGYYDALRAEVETAYGIKVSVILPGSVQTAIATNSLTATGDVRGSSDANIDNGLPAEEAAARIVAGMEAGAREIPVAEGMEAAALGMRAANPEAVFQITAEQGRLLAEARAKGELIEPPSTQ